jgi:hypothetical protein
MNKLIGYSDPREVLKKGKKMGYKISVSTRKDKKYMIENPDGKMVHFGAMGFTDFSHHLDEKRRQSFLKRNWRWKDADPYSPAFLSYHILWT